MAHQIIFTSLPRTLRGGSGYGIAAQTANVPNVLSEEITKLAGYVEIYPGKDPNRRFNPVNYLFYKFNSWYILGRIISAENDYSGRFNYLGQFFVLEQNEIQDCGPAAILKDLPFIESFEGEARILQPFSMPRGFAPNSTVCKAWESVTGDAGWGGLVAERIRSNQSAPILYDKTLHGVKALALLAESLNLLSPAERWGATFSTHVEGFPKGNQVRIRMLQQGGELTREFKNNSAIIDLTKTPLELGTETPLITEARTGERPSAIRQQVLRQSEPAVVVAQTDFDDSEPIGLAVEAGIPAIPGQKAKNWVATPPNLSPPKMGKQKRINYGRDTDDFKNDSFSMNRRSAGIPPWVWALLSVACLIFFIIGIWLGIYFNRTGLEETQQNVEAGNGKIKEKDEEIAKLNSQIGNFKSEIKDINKKSADEISSKNEEIKKRDEELAKKETEKTRLEKYKNFIVDKSGLVKNKADSDDDILKKVEEELKKLRDANAKSIAKENTENQKLINSLINMPEDFKSIPELINKFDEFDKKIGNSKNKDLEKLMKFDRNLKRVMSNRFNAKANAQDECSSILKKTIEDILGRQKGRAESIEKNDLILSNPKKMEEIFGVNSESKKNRHYIGMDQDWFKMNGNTILTPGSNYQKDFINKCVVFFLEKIGDESIFFESDGKFVKERFEYLKTNGANVKTFMNHLKEEPSIKSKQDKVDKFNDMLNKVFNIQ